MSNSQKKPSKLSKRRKAVGWEELVPCCKECKHFQFGKTLLRNSIQVHTTDNVCLKHSFPTLLRSCCDDWETRRGERLRADPSKSVTPTQEMRG